jgi:GalNAc5-diNAcBac-PP-undecaprenol beta-1,3-glucosyltransferase
MPRISVLLPTHEHASTLPYAVRSVQAQGVDDLEILICGDGVSNELRAVIIELQRTDSRIRFFDLPKAPRRGELNRDHVLRQAKGQIICYNSDDDLWLPGHIEVLERALEDSDFVGAMQVNVDTDGKVRGHYFDLERREFVEPWLDWKPNNFGSWACNGFAPIFVAHRQDAFLRLPEGWTTTPVGLPSDQTMWHKFLRQPWCRAKFLRWPIALHFPARDRDDWLPEQRAEELRHWTEIIESPDYAVRIWRDVLPDLGDRLLCQSLNAIAQIRELATQIADFQRMFDATREAADERIRQLEHQLDALARAAAAQVLKLQTTFDAERSASTDRIRELERVLNSEQAAATARIRELEMTAESERNAMLSSTSWRTTAPLRRAVDWIRRFRSG